MACSVLAVLMTMILGVYRAGATSWRTLERHSTLAQQGLAALDRMSRELEESTYGSLSFGPRRDALAFLVATRDEDAQFDFDPATGKPRWDHYLVLYHDAAAQELRQVEVPLAAGSAQVDAPGPLEAYDPGTGPRALETYATGGRVVARGIRSCRFTADDRLVTTEMLCAEPPSTQPDRISETVTLRSSTFLRN